MLKVLYHAPCADGFAAAWAVRALMGDLADYIPVKHGEPPPDVAGHDVIMVDFCYPPEVMLSPAIQWARSIIVLDHHKSAMEGMLSEPRTGSEHLTLVRLGAGADWATVKGLIEMDKAEGIMRPVIYALFDMYRSGAGITWDFFHPDTPRPQLINHIEDRDLWRLALPHTKDIQAAVFSYPYDFEVWDSLMAPDMLPTLRSEGKAIQRKHMKDMEELVWASKRIMQIGGHHVPTANLPYTFASEAGQFMLIGTHDAPFAASYWDTETHRHFSLRSMDDRADVSVIAKAYGGGGHRNAAGFRVPRDHELARA